MSRRSLSNLGIQLDAVGRREEVFAHRGSRRALPPAGPDQPRRLPARHVAEQPRHRPSPATPKMVSWSGKHGHAVICMSRISAGGASRSVGREFITWITPEFGRRWLDVGCGTGTGWVTRWRCLLARHQYDYIVCGLVLNFILDPAAALAEMCRSTVRRSRVTSGIIAKACSSSAACGMPRSP